MVDTFLRQRLFVASYEEGSFTLAARREHATQSGVTQHIRQLEEYLGVKLFVRGNGNGNVQPTPAGELYYNACLKVLRMHSESRRAVGAFRDAMEGTVVVGLTPLMTRAVLAPALAGFMREHPNVAVRVVETYADMVAQKARAGEIDFGIVHRGQDAVGAWSQAFGSTPMFLVSGPHAGLELQPGHPVRLSELGGLKLVVPARQAAGAELDSYLASCGACIDRRIEIDSPIGTLDFVANTDWVSLQPAVMLLRDESDANLICSPLAPPAYMDLSVIAPAREPMQPAAAAFCEMLQLYTSIAVEAAISLRPMAPCPPRSLPACSSASG